MPDENQVATPEVIPVVEEVKVKEELKPLTIQELFQKTMQRQSKTLMLGKLVGFNGGTKYHMSKEKAKQKRKVARASRKRNRS